MNADTNDLSNRILDALLVHRRPMTRSELAGAAGSNIRKVAPHINALVANGTLLTSIRKVGNVTLGKPIPIEHTFYQLAGPRIVR